MRNVCRAWWVTVVALTTASSGRSQSAAESNAGYIDSALPMTQLRLRSDVAYDNRSANRAEFIYPQPRPGGPGFPRPESSIDTIDVGAYLEYAVWEDFSAFAELPVRWINPEVNDNSAGLADVNAGFKWLFLRLEGGALTFQFRTYAPSGDGGRGLGTRHVSLEPALLGCQRLGERWNVEGELRYWTPLDGTDFAGDLVRYGLGLNYHLADLGRLHLIPMMEVVGWTVFDGRVSQAVPGGPVLVSDADGDTILDAKVGMRFRLDCVGDGYVGYGRPLTGDRWYEDHVRCEFRVRF